MVSRATSRSNDPLEPFLNQVVAELRSSHLGRVIDVQFRMGAPIICDPRRAHRAACQRERMKRRRLAGRDESASPRLRPNWCVAANSRAVPEMLPLERRQCRAYKSDAEHLRIGRQVVNKAQRKGEIQMGRQLAALLLTGAFVVTGG